MKIIIDDRIPFISGALESVAEVIYLPGAAIKKEIVKDADALIVRTRTKCNRELLEGSSVRFIATATIGYDHIDTQYCKEAGIEWTNAPGCNAGSVEQYVVSALLTIAAKNQYQLRGKTIGIIGVGNVGSKVARAAEALGCHILLNDPPRAEQEGEEGFAGLDHLLEASDIVTLHVPLVTEGPYPTFQMANGEFFGKLKKGAIFFNTSRGEVVHETALKKVIHSGKIAHAVADVYANEPSADGELISMLTISTPHIAGYSTDGKANGTTMSVQAVSRYFNLGLDNWEPTNIPAPGIPEIFVDGSGPDEIEIISDAYVQTYDVMMDHESFISNPGEFERLRGEYRSRREPSAFHLRLYNDDGKYRKIFEGLGFDVIGDSCF